MDRVKAAEASWFPGQMARTRRLIRENLQFVGLVIEVADARAPRSTRHPGLDKLVPGRPILTVLAKADLAEPEATACWIARLSELGRPGDAAVSFTEAEHRDAREVVRLAETLGRKRSGGGDPGRAAIRAMVVGLPNVGKSTLINRLVGRASARTGDRPGITRGKQWLRAGTGPDRDQRAGAGSELDLLDLPGILVPGRLPAKVALTLALLGILPAQAFDPVEAALHALGVLEAAGRLPAELVGDRASPEGPGREAERRTDLLARYAALRGHLRAGGKPDTERAAVALVGALREGRFGPLTLESPGDRP